MPRRRHRLHGSLEPASESGSRPSRRSSTRPSARSVDGSVDQRVDRRLRWRRRTARRTRSRSPVVVSAAARRPLDLPDGRDLACRRNVVRSPSWRTIPSSSTVNSMPSSRKRIITAELHGSNGRRLLTSYRTTPPGSNVRGRRTSSLSVSAAARSAVGPTACAVRRQVGDREDGDRQHRPPRRSSVRSDVVRAAATSSTIHQTIGHLHEHRQHPQPAHVMGTEADRGDTVWTMSVTTAVTTPTRRSSRWPPRPSAATPPAAPGQRCQHDDQSDHRHGRDRPRRQVGHHASRGSSGGSVSGVETTESSKPEAGPPRRESDDACDELDRGAGADGDVATARVRREAEEVASALTERSVRSRVGTRRGPRRSRSMLVTRWREHGRRPAGRRRAPPQRHGRRRRAPRTTTT